MVSASVHDYVDGRLACRFEDAGERQVHNFARPVHAFRVLPAAIASPIEPDTRPVLQLSLFGPVTLHLAGREIRTRSLKLRAMLGYVALTESLRETRERLVGLLWSEFERGAGARRAAAGGA